MSSSSRQEEDVCDQPRQRLFLRFPSSIHSVSFLNFFMKLKEGVTRTTILGNSVYRPENKIKDGQEIVVGRTISIALKVVCVTDFDIILGMD